MIDLGLISEPAWYGVADDQLGATIPGLKHAKATTSIRWTTENNRKGANITRDEMGYNPSKKWDITQASHLTKKIFDIPCLELAKFLRLRGNRPRFYARIS